MIIKDERTGRAVELEAQARIMRQEVNVDSAADKYGWCSTEYRRERRLLDQMRADYQRRYANSIMIW